MKLRAEPARSEPPEVLRARIEAFVAHCREPAAFEPGERTIPLEAGRYDLAIHGTGVVLHAWSPETSLVRRVLRVVRENPRIRLELETHRLGRGEGLLTIVDLARAGPHVERHVSRLEFRERFRRLLARPFGGWEVAQISSAADLEHSLSPAYARALLVQGRRAFAAIAAEDQLDSATCDHVLSFGLVWLDYLRSRERRRAIEALKVFVPLKRSSVTANRLAFLDSSKATYELFEYGPDGSIARVDERNYGNLKTSLDPAIPPSDARPPVSGWIERLVTGFGAERVPRADGLWSLRIRGLEFARASGAVMTYGVGRDEPVTGVTFHLVESLAEEIGDPRYPVPPERWLESMVRAHADRLDSALRPAPLYTQVPAVAGADRGILDLLGCDIHGQLAVLELKASEDIHLPLQGLDYWMRVKWHLDRDEFRRRGYFPGIELQTAPPRLLLASPVFDFHPTTETILRYFSPQVEVERIGLGADWRKELKVVFRARGSERPAWSNDATQTDP